MSGASYEEQPEPVIRDKRRMDPETYERRDAADGGADQSTAPPSGAAGEGDAEGAAAPAEDARAAEVLDLQDQLARAKADAYNAEQRHNAFVKRSREQEAAARERGAADVVEAVVPVLDDIALARQHGDLTGPFLAVAEKLEQVLSSRFGVERFGEVGDEFDPAHHEALMHATSAEATATTITMVAQPGYRRGTAVIRPARVGVTGPE
ncbi:nucleotide exchange factor GrpE [Litorihabitans aurantiacus]|uniref:Protein GrpE n=1 Tax=Litorihabitans aurantiacus TaxID=1930061 RepID=A0AA38CR00_9MICO|nr:nucleotide exchange factor GrpE [Litorihabitans aurantiacus]GMA32633.1 protein GrpE [Litorihabitans aurantiacus]